MYSVVNEYKGTAFSSKLASKYKLVGKQVPPKLEKLLCQKEKVVF